MPTIRPLTIPIWNEGRVPLERAQLLRSPVARGVGVPRGDGAPVLLISGFLAGDMSLSPMAKWLRDLGYRPCRAGIVANVDCTTKTITRLEQRLETLAERYDRPVRIVGHSRGGIMARLLAIRNPEQVEQIITLGSPLLDQFAVHPLVRVQVRATALLGSLGVPGLFRFACQGDCCRAVLDQVTVPFPPGIAFTSVYSKADGVVDWRVCLDPAAEHVEVTSSHSGMAVNAHVWRAVALALARDGVELTVPPTVRAVAA